MLFNPKRQEVHVLAIWRYFIYSVLVGRCSRSLNSPLLLMIQGLFKSIFTIVLFKGPKETRDVSTFLTFQIFWIFLCRFPYLEVHYSANCTLHCHQQSKCMSTKNSGSWHEKYILGCVTHQNVTLVVKIYFVKVKIYRPYIYKI